MLCEKCGTECWDNRITKKNPKGPDYKCKNPDCAHAIWLTPFPKKQEAPVVKSFVPEVVRPTKPDYTPQILLVLDEICKSLRELNIYLRSKNGSLKDSEIS